MRYTWIIFLALSFAGCASEKAYNPMQSSQQELLLNESGFKALQDGMSMDQIHKIMGQELTIGYAFKSPDYKPMTIPNPYKSEDIKGTNYTVEYYIESIRQPDGVVSDNELMPLIYKDGKLTGRGWSLLNSLQSHKSPA